MSNVIRIHHPGGPEALRWESAEPLREPQAGEIKIRHTAVGLNFIDCYQRSGLYPVAMPAILGFEAAGVVTAAGPKSLGFKKGDRVAYATGPLGAYCQERIFPAEKAVKLPSSISDEWAAAIMLKGMTVEYLFHRTYPLKKGDVILFHAAAGGVGVLACQWAKALGVQMIGTVGSSEKAALAKKYGCKYVIDYSKESIQERVKAITRGKGVKVVYDSVGKDTFQASLDCLAPRGTLVSFGQASGPVPPQNLSIFAAKNLYYTRPTLFVYNATRAELEKSARKVFQMIGRKFVRVLIGKTYALRDAAQAHRALESRKLSGSTLLIP